ncbi:MAG TPA: alpha/beta hydrolase [Dongiaceae bacterium]|jgi:hypothetical protein
MTLFIDFRTANTGGAVTDPRMIDVDLAALPTLGPKLDDHAIENAVTGRNLLLGTHGFNVHRLEGVRSLARLDGHLRAQGWLGSADLFIGVLWPGDFWIPAINYPFEGTDAIDCGKRLAAFCNKELESAQSFSFLSHSLGARLILEAVKRLNVRATSVCLAAAAINRDCLATEYAAAARNSDSISVLASHEDRVLQVAFPVGDPISNVLHRDHEYFRAALGYAGPPRPAAAPIKAPWQIPDKEDYGHGNYLPPSAEVAPADPHPQWLRVAEFMANAFNRRPQGWPS